MDEREIMALVRDHLPHAYLNSPNAACRLAHAIRNAALEEACAAIKEKDDRASAKYYMLYSDDCISVVRALKTKEGE